MKRIKFALLALAALAIRAGELTPEVEAKFLKAILASSGSNKIACSESTLKAALEAQGLVVDSGAPIAWCTSPTEAKNLKAFGRLVITNRRELAAHASIIIQEDGGRPKIMLNTANLRTAKIQLGDAILKIAEKI